MTTENRKLEFFAISPARLALFSILTLGLYQIFWFYKNWQGVEKVAPQTLSPLGLAIVPIFFCHRLFSKILQSAKTAGYEKSFSPKFQAAIYIVLVLAIFAGILTGSAVLDLKFFWLVLALFSFLPLLPVQRAINFNHAKIFPNHPGAQALVKGEAIVVVLGIIWPWLTVLGTFSSFRYYVSEQLIETSGWREFEAKDNTFKVAFPIPPTHETENLKIGETALTFKYDSYASEVADGTSYFVNVSSYPSQLDFSNPQAKLEDALSALRDSVEGNKTNFVKFYEFR